MDERGNKRSMDLITCLQKFISEFDEQKPKIISELNKIFEKIKEKKDILGKKAATAGATSAGVGGVGAAVLAGVLSPLTGGLSLAVAKTAAVVGAAAAVAGVVVEDEISNKLTLDKVMELVLSFCGLADQLKNIEKEKSEMFEKPNLNPEAVLVLFTLIDQLNSLYALFTEETTVQRLLEVKEKCELILKELDKIKRFYKIKMIEEQEQLDRDKLETLLKEKELFSELEMLQEEPERSRTEELLREELHMLSLQSGVKMEEKGNRKSMDLIIFFQEFISEFDKQKPKIISELNEIFEQTKKRKEGLDKKAATAGVVSAGFSGVGAAVLASVLAPFTGGLSLVVAGASAAAVGAAAAVTGVVVKDEISDKRTLDKVMELVLSFCGMAEQLKNIEKEKSEMLEKPNLKPEAVIVLFTLIDQLDSLYLLFTEETTVQRLLEVKEKCELILIEWRTPNKPRKRVHLILPILAAWLFLLFTFGSLLLCISRVHQRENFHADAKPHLNFFGPGHFSVYCALSKLGSTRGDIHGKSRTSSSTTDTLPATIHLTFLLLLAGDIQLNPGPLSPALDRDGGGLSAAVGETDLAAWGPSASDIGGEAFGVQIEHIHKHAGLQLDWPVLCNDHCLNVPECKQHAGLMTTPTLDTNATGAPPTNNPLVPATRINAHSDNTTASRGQVKASEKEHAQKEKCAQTGLKSQYLKNQSKQNQSQTKPEPGLKLV
ncbi:hypothetical protein WMY93_020868 [Mugilogobius chulae]|uniref:Uncharacterized protein n=1 Tax=Mugilogobius chulae TaxID=88201 RepID=A0AAW0NG63_9GOBI